MSDADQQGQQQRPTMDEAFRAAARRSGSVTVTTPDRNPEMNKALRALAKVAREKR